MIRFFERLKKNQISLGYLLLIPSLMAFASCSGSSTAPAEITSAASEGRNPSITAIRVPEEFRIDGSCNVPSVNNNGEFIFRCYKADIDGSNVFERSYLRTADGNIRALPVVDSEAELRIADSGEVSGTINGLYSRIDTNGAVQTLISDEYSIYGKESVSSNGQYVVGANRDTGDAVIFENGMRHPLLIDGKVERGFYPAFVNSQGTIVGWYFENQNQQNGPNNEETQLFASRNNGPLEAMHTGSTRYFNFLSDNDTLIGVTLHPDGSSETFYYSIAAGRQIDLSAALPEPEASIIAENRSGLLLADSFEESPQGISNSSFITKVGGEPKYLIEMLPPDSHWRTVNGDSLSNSGYIAGTGYYNDEYSLFLMKLPGT